MTDNAPVLNDIKSIVAAEVAAQLPALLGNLATRADLTTLKSEIVAIIDGAVKDRNAKLGAMDEQVKKHEQELAAAALQQKRDDERMRAMENNIAKITISVSEMKGIVDRAMDIATQAQKQTHDRAESLNARMSAVEKETREQSEDIEALKADNDDVRKRTDDAYNTTNKKLERLSVAVLGDEGMNVPSLLGAVAALGTHVQTLVLDLNTRQAEIAKWQRRRKLFWDFWQTRYGAAIIAFMAIGTIRFISVARPDFEPFIQSVLHFLEVMLKG